MTKTTYIITGTPRSGLNVLSQCLQLLGLSPLDQHFEIKASTINNLLLQDLGVSPYSPALPEGWMESGAAGKAKSRIGSAKVPAPDGRGDN